MNKDIQYEDDPIKRIDIKEFREIGFLQEVNRLFFHPLGLALEVVVEEDGTEHLGGVWDYRDDPEGIVYSPGTLDQDKMIRVAEEGGKHMDARLELMGSVVQHADSELKLSDD